MKISYNINDEEFEIEIEDKMAIEKFINCFLDGLKYKLQKKDLLLKFITDYNLEDSVLEYIQSELEDKYSNLKDYFQDEAEQQYEEMLINKEYEQELEYDYLKSRL